MINLADYFEPVKLSRKQYQSGFLGNDILTGFSDKTLNQAKLALIGITESRNAYPLVDEGSVDKIRQFFYQLSSIQRLKVVDLGNLKRGTQVKDTYASLEQVTGFLMGKGILPVFFGGSQDLTAPLIRGMMSHKKNLEFSIIDSRFDIADSGDFHSQSYLADVKSQFGLALSGSVIGYQSYFVSQKQLEELAGMNILSYRLGAVRNQFKEIEPVLRDSDLVSFDLASIRYPDCAASSFLSPNGFYAEEACQLTNLAGLSDKLSVFGIFEYDSHKDTNQQTAHLIAQLIWHFLLGVSQRKKDYPVGKLSNYKKIFVKMDKLDMDLVFYQNQQNQRFWVEIPQGKEDNRQIISCSEKDYIDTCNNQIPDRIWQKISFFMK